MNNKEEKSILDTKIFVDRTFVLGTRVVVGDMSVLPYISVVPASMLEKVKKLLLLIIEEARAQKVNAVERKALEALDEIRLALKEKEM